MHLKAVRNYEVFKHTKLQWMSLNDATNQGCGVTLTASVGKLSYSKKRNELQATNYIFNGVIRLYQLLLIKSIASRLTKTMNNTSRHETACILEIGLFYNSPRVKQFYRFQIHSADFLIFRRISVTRQFLVSLTSKVGKNIYYESQWDQKLSGY